jgi:hypothetical protein
MTTSLHTHFRWIPDPRTGNNKKHNLLEVIILSVLADDLFGDRQPQAERLLTGCPRPFGICKHIKYFWCNFLWYPDTMIFHRVPDRLVPVNLHE